MSAVETPVNDPWGDWAMRRFWWNPPINAEEATRRRIVVHLIPYLLFLYILAYIDRSNLSITGGEMIRPIDEGGVGFTMSIIGFGSGIFFWGYWILEMPSTISVLHWGARYVFVRILILWGICCLLLGFIGMPQMGMLFFWAPTIPTDLAIITNIDWAFDAVFGQLTSALQMPAPFQPVASVAHSINGLRTNPEDQFYFLRFMLGFFEGGFFPSVIFYLGLWFRGKDRGKAIAAFMAGIPLSAVIALPIFGFLLDFHWLGLQGWRWVFITQGILPILAGVATLFLLPNRPSEVTWLTAAEKKTLQRDLDEETHGRRQHSIADWWPKLGLVLLLTLVYFCQNVSSYGLSTFMPAIVKNQTGLGDLTSKLLTAVAYVLAFFMMLFNGWHSDRYNERTYHTAIPLTILGCAFLLCAVTEGWGALPAFIMIFIVGTFMYAHLPTFWSIPTTFLGATAAASAIGFINMIGNLGGSLGPTLVGKVADLSKSPTGAVSFQNALYSLAPWPIMAAGIILVIHWLRTWKKREPSS